MLLSDSDLNPALRHANVRVMNFLNEIAQQHPDAISFAPGRPPEQFFNIPDAPALIETFVAHLSKETTASPAAYGRLGQYGRTNGIIADLIAKLLWRDEGLQVDAEDIVVTVGSQEGMCICLRSICGNPADVVLVVEPAYIGISGAALLLGIEVVPVPADEDGVDVLALRDICQRLCQAGKRARILYLCPDFANPTGVTTTVARRIDLLDATKSLDMLIVEDHAYSYFSYDHERQNALKSMPGADHVIYLGSFSKAVFPGLRVGFIIADQRVRTGVNDCTSLADEMSKMKSLFTVNTSPVCQAIVGGLLLRNDCSLRDFVSPRRETLRSNRDAMLAALSKHFGGNGNGNGNGVGELGVTWNRPSGGFFISVRVSFEVTDDDLTTSVREFGVIWTPMSYFFIHATPSKELRLSFSYVTHRQIEIGVAALASFVRRRLHRADTDADGRLK